MKPSWMVGDRWRDIDWGRRAGVRTVFIDYGEGRREAPSKPFLTRSNALGDHEPITLRP